MSCEEKKSIIANSDHRKVLDLVRVADGEDAAVLLIKASMEGILRHYISCNWGACYNTKFKELVQPYLDDVELLDSVLRSDTIEDRDNVIRGKSGAKIFPALLEKLLDCKSQRIRDFLRNEFLMEKHT